jgi:hypothetical protein
MFGSGSGIQDEKMVGSGIRDNIYRMRNTVEGTVELSSVYV